MNAYTLPTTLEAGGQYLHIRNDGDWRMVIDCNLALTDPELNNDERIIAALLIFYDINSISEIQSPEKAATDMMNFLAAGTQSDDTATHNKPKLIDWEYDAPLIVSGINKVIGREVRAESYMHWWTFMSYYMAIGEGVLSTVVGIRDKNLKGKKLEKHERDFMNDNPQYFKADTRDLKAGYELMNELWSE